MSITREIKTHNVEGDKPTLSILADVRDANNGNTSHHYIIDNADDVVYKPYVEFSFQQGPIKEVGVNGITNEALLAVVADRLEGFQSGAYACADNEEALLAVHAALSALQRRTKNRIARGVEGTYVK